MANPVAKYNQCILKLDELEQKLNPLTPEYIKQTLSEMPAEYKTELYQLFPADVVAALTAIDSGNYSQNQMTLVISVLTQMQDEGAGVGNWNLNIDNTVAYFYSDDNQAYKLENMPTQKEGETVSYSINNQINGNEIFIELHNTTEGSGYSVSLLETTPATSSYTLTFANIISQLTQEDIDELKSSAESFLLARDYDGTVMEHDKEEYDALKPAGLLGEYEKIENFCMSI